MKKRPVKTRYNINQSYNGEPLEAKIRRIMNNKEPITDGAEIIYTERKDGVRPEYDIRTDRWEIAVAAMDKVSKTHLTKRQERLEAKNDKKYEGPAKDDTKKDDGGPEPVQATK